MTQLTHERATSEFATATLALPQVQPTEEKNTNQQYARNPAHRFRVMGI